MYNNSHTAYNNDRNVSLAEREQADAIKSNLDKILHYERYRNNADTPVGSVAPVEREQRETVSTLKNSAPESVNYREEEVNDDLRPSSTTMQFGTSEDNDVYEDLAYDKKSEKEEFRLSSKGKILIAVYSIVVAIILSLIVINSRMLKSLDQSISSYGSRIDDLNAEYTRISTEYDSIMENEEEIGKWAADHGMEYGKAA